MISENIDNKKRVGLFSALKAIFSNGEKTISKDDEKVIEKLKAESEKNIKLLEGILEDKKLNRKSLEDKLKVTGDQTIAQDTSKIHEEGKEKEDDEFIK